MRLAVRLTPRAAKERIEGVIRLANNQPVLRVAVSAPPTDGRANAALLDLLAREWRLHRNDLTIAAGHKSRNKLVHIAGDADFLRQHLGAVLAASPRA